MMTCWPMDTCWMSSSGTTNQPQQRLRQQLQRQQVRHTLCWLPPESPACAVRSCHAQACMQVGFCADRAATSNVACAVVGGCLSQPVQYQLTLPKFLACLLVA
jgi:hypothetical protein